ncbi:50S ribosomal protein L10 [Candidatus Kaiserbacteria bacterium]|nr:50S ribosomal protein L10 [Candidatus Kaiserbacteria bacterium]
MASVLPRSTILLNGGFSKPLYYQFAVFTIMAKTRAQKEEAVTKLEKLLKEAASSVFVHFRGIDVAQETGLRRSFRNDGLGYTVAKKSLIRRALGSLGHEATLPLEGEVAIAYNTTSDEPTLAANRVHVFGKEVGTDKFMILGGLFQGALKNADEMRAIATIPPMPVLQAMFAQVINSPRSRFAVVLSKVAETKGSAA